MVAMSDLNMFAAGESKADWCQSVDRVHLLYMQMKSIKDLHTCFEIYIYFQINVHVMYT